MDLSNLTDEQLVELQADIEATKKQRAEREKAAQRVDELTDEDWQAFSSLAPWSTA